MSNHPFPPRALVALVAVSLATSLACASRGAKDTRPSDLRPTDTSAVINSDGKSMEDLFVGRFPGVSVTRTDGGGLRIRIRGGGNMLDSDETLIVVDDTPMPQGSGGIVFLNPHDIAKIEVLKNPADIAIYGLRGGNGVIKITTRRPGS